jgi:hypothetical protein
MRSIKDGVRSIEAALGGILNGPVSDVVDQMASGIGAMKLKPARERIPQFHGEGVIGRLTIIHEYGDRVVETELRKACRFPNCSPEPRRLKCVSLVSLSSQKHSPFHAPARVIPR